MSQYIILILFIAAAYYVLRWLQRRLQTVELPKLAEGQWHPLLANYVWTSENKYKEEFVRLQSSQDSNPTALVQALMKRAMHDVHQMKEMQEQRQTLQQLVRMGNIGEEVWNRFEYAQGLLAQEMEEVAALAEALKPGWGQGIFAQANQMLMLEQRREEELERKREEDERSSQQQWDAEKAAMELKEKEEMAKRVQQELIREEQAEKSKKQQQKKQK